MASRQCGGGDRSERQHGCSDMVENVARWSEEISHRLVLSKRLVDLMEGSRLLGRSASPRNKRPGKRLPCVQHYRFFFYDEVFVLCCVVSELHTLGYVWFGDKVGQDGVVLNF